MASFRFLSTLVGKSLFYLYRLLSVSPSVLSVSSSFCLSVCLICIFFLSLPLSICLSVCLIFLFFLSLSLSICLTLCLICLFFFLSGLCLSFSPSVYLSLPLYICLTLSLSYISICLTRLIYVPMSWIWIRFRLLKYKSRSTESDPHNWLPVWRIFHQVNADPGVYRCEIKISKNPKIQR